MRSCFFKAAAQRPFFKEETRGHKSLVSPEKFRDLETEGIEARVYLYMGEQLGYELWLECSGRTIRKAMGAMEYYKCITCRRGWVSEKKKKKTRKDRLGYATIMLQRYPNPQDWYRVRFSDEVHFGYGP